MQKMRVSILVAFLTFVVMGISGSVTTATSPSQVTFKTPEDAIKSYLDGVTHGDFDKILQACAIDETSENFKFDLSIDRVKAFVPFQSPAPANNPFYVAMNKAQITSQIATQVKILVFSLLSTEKVSDGSVILMDVDRANAFIKAVDPARLATLEVKELGLPHKSLMNSTRYQDNAAKLARVYGADESTERVVLFSFEQNYYYTGFTIFRYGDAWKISNQTSGMAGTSGTGAPQKTTVEDFETLINS